jgi:excisionase family DNA binding protein
MGDQQAEPSEFLSLAEAAKLVGLHPTALLRRIQSGRLRHVRIGNTYGTTLQWISESVAPGKMGRPPKQLPDHLRPADSTHVPRNSQAPEDDGLNR